MPGAKASAARLIAVVAAFVVVFSISSCMDDFPPSCPFLRVGAVQGFVRSAGQGIATSVGARALEGPSEGLLVCETMSDSTGWYRLDLPTGFYRMEVDPFSGGLIASDMRDTIRVAPLVHRCDLMRGRAEITVAMPDEVEGRRVELRLQGQTFDRASLTESVVNGSLLFVFPAMRPGTYHMQLRDVGHGNLIPLSGAWTPGAVDSLTIGSETVASHTADFRALYVSISGHVTGSWLEAHSAPPRVEAMSTASQSVCYSDCGSDGSFTIDLFVPQQVRLRTTLDDLHQWLGGDSFETALVFDPQPGDRITGVSLVESGIEVRLEGPGDLVRHQASVRLRNEAGDEFAPRATGDNPIAVCNLRPGRYLLHVDGQCNDQIWLPQWYDGVAVPEDAMPIDLAEGELRRIVVTLVEGGGIAGRLLTSDGRRPQLAFGALFDGDGEEVCSSPHHIYDGVFEFRGLSDGDYYLAVTQYGYGAWWWPGTFEFNEAARITIAGHAAVTDLQWSLPPPAKGARP